MDDLEQLRPRLAARDAEAWRALIHALSDRLFRYVRPMVRDDDAARDVVQQAFIRLHGAKLRAAGSLRTACFFIATNLVRETYRKAATRSRHEQEAAMAEAIQDDPARHAMANEAWRSAMQLPHELREVVLLRYGEGFTAAEAAAVLGIPEGTVKTRQRKALESLRGSALAAPALLHEGAQATPVPAGLANSMEGMVMANLGTKTTAGAGLITALLLGGSAALLLLGAGAYLLFQSGDEEREAKPQSAHVAGEDTVPADGSADVSSAVDEEEGGGADAQPVESEASEEPAPPSRPEARAPKEITIRGSVVDQAGNGIAGAEVSYVAEQKRVPAGQESAFVALGRGTSWLPFEADRWKGAASQRRIADVKGTWGTPTYRSINVYHPEPAVTDDEGRYEIAAPMPQDRPAFRLFMRATALGYQSVGESVSASTNTDGETTLHTQDFTMQGLSRFVVFRTVPETEEISARAVTNDRGTTGHSSAEVFPGPGGTHQIGIPRGTLSKIEISAAGFARLEMEIKDDGQRVIDLGVIKLPVGRRISGVVRSPDGILLADAQLRLLSDPACHAATSEDGSFTIEGASEGTALLAARHEAFAEAHVEVPAGKADLDGLTLTMKTGVQVTVDVRLPPNSDEAAWVALIRDVPGTEVREWNIEHGYELDESGRAVFERVAPGTYQARAAIGRRHVHQRVEVRGTHTHVSLAFGTGGRVYGAVIDRDGSPLANEGIRLLRLPDQMDVDQADTGLDGSYAIEDVADGEYVVLVKSRDMTFTESFLASRRVVIADGNAVEMKIDYSQRPLGNVLRGRVTLGGQPRFEGVILLGAGLTGGTMIGRCEPDGSFEINAIPPGEYYVLIAAAKSRMGPRLPIRFDGWDGEQVIERDFQGVTLELRLQGEDVDHSLVRYALFPHDDEPFGPDAMGLMLGSHDWGDETVKRIEHLPAQRYWLTVSAPGFADAVVSVDTIRQREVTVELKRNAGTAVFNAGNSPAAVLERAGEDMIRRAAFLLIYRDGAVVSRQGFQIQPGELMRVTTLAPGSYRGLLLGTGVEEAEVAFDVREGESTQVALPLRPAARATINVSNAEIAPGQLAQAAVRLYDATTNEPVRPFAHVSAFQGGVQAPAEGIDIGPLKAGSYRAEIQLPGYQPATVRFQVQPGQEVRLEVTLAAE